MSDRGSAIFYTSTASKVSSEKSIDWRAKLLGPAPNICCEVRGCRAIFIVDGGDGGTAVAEETA